MCRKFVKRRGFESAAISKMEKKSFKLQESEVLRILGIKLFIYFFTILLLNNAFTTMLQKNDFTSNIPAIYLPTLKTLTFETPEFYQPDYFRFVTRGQDNPENNYDSRNVMNDSAMSIDELDPKTITPAEIELLQSLDSVHTEDEVQNSNLGESSSASNKEKNTAKTKKTKPQAHKIYKQKFRKQWLTDFKWVSESNDKPFCKLCNSNVMGSSFHLKRHAESASHIKKVNAITNVPDIAEAINRISLEDHVKNAELKLSCFICEHNLPFQLMDALPKMCANTFVDSEIARNLKIARNKSTNVVLTKLAPYAKNELVEKLRKNLFCMIVDEATDISTTKSLVIIVRFWDEDGVHDRFLDLIVVTDGTAEALFTSVKTILDDNRIPYKNLVGFAADNASVMMGVHTGLGERLKELNPDLFVLGCVCHSAHLCASSASTKLPASVEQLSRDIYTYVSQSSKRLSELKECQIFAQEKPLKMLYPGQTRWLSIIAVVNRILENWGPLTLFFGIASTEDKLPMAQNVYSALRNNIYRIYLTFLSYVLELITDINKEFQSEKPKLPHLLERVSCLYKLLLKSFIKPEVLNKSHFSRISVINPRNYLPLESMYFGAKVDNFLKDEKFLVDAKEVHDFKLKALDYYVELCSQISSRFDFNSPVLNFVSNFTIKNALSGKINSIAYFNRLFPSIKVNPERVNIEWQNLSETFNYEDYKNVSNIDFWLMVSKTKNDLSEPLFPNLMQVVKYIMVLPHSSAASERAFSQLKLMKTRIRNRLNIKTIAAALRIKDAIKHNIINYQNLSARQIYASLDNNCSEVNEEELSAILKAMDDDEDL